MVLLTACGEPSVAESMDSARSYLARRDDKAAIIELKNVLQKRPDLGEARFLLGKASLRAGDAAAAVAELRRAADLQYPAAQVLPELARALLLQNEQKELIEQYARIDLPDPAAAADLKTSIATAYALQGEVANARTALAAALKDVADYPAALKMQSRLFAGERQFDAALARVDKVIANDPKDAQAWHFKGEFLLYGKGDVVSAQEAYRRATSLQADYAPARASLIALLLARRDLTAAAAEIERQRTAVAFRAQMLYFEAELAFLEKDDKRANELIQQVLRVSPDDVKALQLAGAVQINLRLLSQAERLLRRAVQLAPDAALPRRLLAQAYLRSGQPAPALATLAPLLVETSADAKAAALAAEANLQMGHLREAQDEFSMAAALDPEDIQSRVAAAAGRLNAGAAGGAMSELESIAATEKGSFAALALLSAHLRDKDYPRAFKVIDAIEAKQPGKPLAAMLRGQAQLMQGEMAQARQSFERALALDPTYVAAASVLARLDLADGKPAVAAQRFATVLSADPKNLEALLAIAGLREREGAASAEVAALLTQAVKLNPAEAKPRVLLVDHFLAHGAPKAALAAAQDAVAALSNDAESLDALGRAQIATGDSLQGTATFVKLANLAPRSPVAWMRLAGVQAAAKDFDAAIQSVRHLLSISPDMLSAQQLLMHLEMQAGHPHEALLVARTVQKQRPGEAVGYMLEGAFDIARKDLPAAIDIYRLATSKRSPSDAAVKLHSTLVASGKGAEAERFASSWKLSHPRDAAFLFYLGEAALAERQFAPAEREFRAVLRLAPDSAPALNNLAWIMSKLHEPGAVQYAQKATSLAPGTPALLDTLAGAYASEGRLTDALDTQRQAVALAPNNLTLRLNLAKIYLQTGDKPKARAELLAVAGTGDKTAVNREASLLLASL